ncbi:GIY-YIG nuclease family protein [Candidatus Uhrbacteria bacterium]|nr:GIY-YIG nuclease family protein [Candidatus Uhrbacteria bacterium]
MHYVYILRSKNLPNQIYKGSTSNLRNRLEQHNAGQVPHTSKFKLWSVIWYSAFISQQQAAQFEKYLKTASGIAFMRKHLIQK